MTSQYSVVVVFSAVICFRSVVFTLFIQFNVLMCTSKYETHQTRVLSLLQLSFGVSVSESVGYLRPWFPQTWVCIPQCASYRLWEFLFYVKICHWSVGSVVVWIFALHCIWQHRILWVCETSVCCWYLWLSQLLSCFIVRPHAHNVTVFVSF